MSLACRFYANEFPDIEEPVMVKVTDVVANMGAYVTLTEYNNREGFIPTSELSRRRIRSVAKLIRPGQSVCVIVTRVDKEKGYIDLSKKRVYSGDFIKCQGRYARSKAVCSILRHVADQLGYTEDSQLEEFFDKTAWHFDRKFRNKGAANDVFKKALTDSSVLDECDISKEARDKLLEEIKKKLTPQALKIRSDIEVTCFTLEGIEAIKIALLKGKKFSTEQVPIKIHLIAAPQYAVTVQTMERIEGVELVKKALDAIKTSIETAGGEFKIITEPKVSSDLDEEELKKRMELLGLEDDDEEESESGSEEEEEEGLMAPKELDQEADANETKAQAKAEDEDKDSD